MKKFVESYILALTMLLPCRLRQSGIHRTCCQWLPVQDKRFRGDTSPIRECFFRQPCLRCLGRQPKWSELRSRFCPKAGPVKAGLKTDLPARIQGPLCGSWLNYDARPGHLGRPPTITGKAHPQSGSRVNAHSFSGYLSSVPTGWPHPILARMQSSR